jgi:hypothetical protein
MLWEFGTNSVQLRERRNGYVNTYKEGQGSTFANLALHSFGVTEVLGGTRDLVAVN